MPSHSDAYARTDGDARAFAYANGDVSTVYSHKDTSVHGYAHARTHRDGHAANTHAHAYNHDAPDAVSRAYAYIYAVSNLYRDADVHVYAYAPGYLNPYTLAHVYVYASHAHAEVSARARAYAYANA